MLNAHEPPPAVFWFLLHRCKRNSPAGETIPSPRPARRRNPLFHILGNGRTGRWGHRPLRRGGNLVRRADEDIRPYGGAQSCYGGCTRSGPVTPFRRAQRRNEVSHKVLCQAFFQESAGRIRDQPLRRKGKKIGTLGGVPILYRRIRSENYLAYSMALVSRSRCTLICPGYSSSSSIFLAISRASRTI